MIKCFILLTSVHYPASPLTLGVFGLFLLFLLAPLAPWDGPCTPNQDQVQAPRRRHLLHWSTPQNLNLVPIPDFCANVQRRQILSRNNPKLASISVFDLSGASDSTLPLHRPANCCALYASAPISSPASTVQHSTYSTYRSAAQSRRKVLACGSCRSVPSGTMNPLILNFTS